VRALSASVGPAALMVAVAACGVGPAASYDQSHTAQQIVSDASASTGKVTSFHVTMDVTTKDGPANADLDVEGPNIGGKVAAQGAAVRIIHVNDKTFVYGSDLAASLAATNPQAAATVTAKAADKWVLMPPEFWSSSSLGDIINLPQLATCLKTEAGLTKKGTSTMSGQQVVEVDNQLAGRMFVQTAAPHYYVRVALQGVDTCISDTSVTQETMNFTKLGQKLNVTAPSDYVDLSTLANG
jgi:hypothetical protein